MRNIEECKICSSAHWANSPCTFCIKAPILKRQYEEEMREKRRKGRKDFLNLVAEFDSILNHKDWIEWRNKKVIKE